MNWTDGRLTPISTDSGLRVVVITGFCLADDFRPGAAECGPRPDSAILALQQSQSGGRTKSSRVASSSFLNSYIIQTHFRMNGAAAAAHPDSSRGRTARPEEEEEEGVICFRSYRSHSSECLSGTWVGWRNIMHSHV